MLILIICGILLILGIAMIVVAVKVNCSYFNSKGNCIFNCEILENSGVAFTALSATALFIVGISAIVIQACKEKNYQDALYERQVLEYRLEHEEANNVGNEMLYSEIVDFNNELREHKHYSDNLWIGIFFNDKIANIEYIDISKTNQGEKSCY